MELYLKITPSEEPITLNEVRSYLKISTDQENDHLNFLIASARAYVEGSTGRALLKQKWEMRINPPYPRSTPLVKQEGKRLEIKLPHPPLLSIESVLSHERKIHYSIEDGKIVLSSSFWNQEIMIQYWAGYGEKPEALPPNLKLAVLIATRLFYDHQPVDLTLLQPFKIHHLI